MEVFSLLKFWRNAGGGDTIAGDGYGNFDFPSEDEESFFDLVLTGANSQAGDNDDGASPTVNVVSGIHSNQYQTFSKLDGADSKSDFTYSSPDSVIFTSNKRKILPLDSSNSKPQSPFRVAMLAFSKSKPEKMEMKCEIEEVKISSLLKRDNSLRSKLRTEKLLDQNDQPPSKRFSKEAVQKYLNLNLIKPLYVKVSKRNNEKVKSPEMMKSETPSSSPAISSVFSPRKEEKPAGSRGAVLKEVRKHLGKSRSSSSDAVVRAVQSPAIRSDDTALQQQDGIQSAILHCKRSYNSPSQGCSVLSRSGSAPSNNQPRISIDEEKEAAFERRTRGGKIYL